MVATDGRPVLAQPAMDQLQSAACELVLDKSYPHPIQAGDSTDALVQGLLLRLV